MVAEQLLPYQWDALNDRLPNTEKSHCLDNFRVAAGERPGRHKGAIWQDTDLYKWLETVAFCVESGTNAQYQPIADEAIALIGRAQEPDGYINTFFTIQCPEKKWSNLVEGHELYSGGHLIEAAVAYYNATGKDAFLTIARRFADLVYEVFGVENGKCHGYPGHQEIELALVKLYRVTGEKRYLELANYFIRQRGQHPNYLLEEIAGRNGQNLIPEFYEYDDKYAQSHLPVLEQATAEGHAVRATYMYSAMADLALEYGDRELGDACDTIFKNIVGRRMYITGGIGSSGKLERFTADYDLPNDRMYCESCASIGLMMFGQRMAALTGEADYYDAVERALCNTVLAGISKEGDSYFYVNPLEVWPDNCLESTSMSHVKPVRQKWFACACCPPNIARTLASLGQYIYSESAEALYVNQFISSEVETAIGARYLRLSMASTYMQDGRVKISADCGDGEVQLRVRIPGYFKNPVMNINGQAMDIKLEKGYAILSVLGHTEIEFKGEVLPRFVAANRNVRADMGRIAVMKGPYVYCLEQEDNGENLAAVYTSPGATLREQAPENGLPGKLPTLEFEGERLTKTIDEEEELYGTPSFHKQPVMLKSIPYALWCNRTPGEMQVWMKATP